MVEIGFSHGSRQYFCLVFMVGMLLHFTTSFSSKLDTTTTGCDENDRKFLLDILPHPDMLPVCLSFNQSIFLDCCNMPGISCSNISGRIIDLELFPLLYSLLSSFSCQEFPQFILKPSLLSLEDLSTLHLDTDAVSFSKGFGSFIRSFPNLQHLYLNPDWVDGMGIPRDIENLTRLETLEVYSDNYSIYAKTLGMFSRLTSLKRLVLNHVNLSEAMDWVDAVSNLPRLVHLELTQCNLPDARRHSRPRVNSSKSLVYLDLSDNNLASSSSWSWIFNHSSLISCGLRFLDVSKNRIQGDLVSIFRSLSCANESLISLSLNRNLFSGSLPDFTMFSSLSKLSLHSNKLNGSLPSFVNRHSSLTIFDVHNNELVGSIPDLSVFRSLKVLQLRNNKLNGSVHSAVGQLSMLRLFDISSNSLKDDLGITHFANLSSLRYLDLSFNSLTLNVGSSWVPPFRLDTIGLGSCGLGSSRFPEWLRTQTNYSRLDLSNSGISDKIPIWFWNLSSKASSISLAHNSLRGKLPTDLSNVFDIEATIDLSSNLLDGTIPSFNEDISYLNLSRNSFSGPVAFLCPYIYVHGIDLSHNNLSGKLPDCWSKFRWGYVLDLSNNSFSGQLPSSLGLSSFSYLHLRNNNFSGKLPVSLCNLTALSYLDLGDNLFSGEIPACLGHLNVLSLRNNSFSGIIPPQLCNPYIQILDLSMNNISGVIPHCLCNLQAMTQKKISPGIVSNGLVNYIVGPYKDYVSLVLKGYLYDDANHLELVKCLDLSSNSLTGEIPVEISCLTGLVSLNFSRNNLTGSITSKIGSLKSLESLDLSNNHLSGEIPSTISDLNFLGTLSLANNNLSGRIPSGTQIQGFNASSFSGNPRLCGEPLSDKCPGDGDGKGSNVEDARNLKENDDDRAFYLGLCISVLLGFITGFWAFCGALVLKRSWRVAYFRAWIRAYDTLYVMVMVRIRRRYLA